MAVARDNPYSGYNFIVTIEGVIDDGHRAQTSFSEVSGLGVEITPIDYRTGAERTPTVRKLPGLTKYPEVSLKRGVTGDLALWSWVKQAADGTVQRARVTIVQLDEERRPVLTFTLANAWPVKFTGPTLDASASEVAFEEIVLCHEGLEIE